MFEKEMHAGWGDMGFNSHMRNTAYLDKSGDVRMMFFSENGFSMNEFIRQRIGPIIMKDEMEYFRDIRLLEKIRVTLSVAGLSEDGSRFLMRNDFFLESGGLAARVTSMGGWMGLVERKLLVPPEALLNAVRSLGRTDDFQTLPSAVKG
ncbi:MAG: thioesterase family protein [Spirochaetes bacterium]|jgi:acyl-CoA thioester hydrolase|nr:thioesterase family protein [Spirochaetota bacterium]